MHFRRVVNIASLFVFRSQRMVSDVQTDGFSCLSNVREESGTGYIMMVLHPCQTKNTKSSCNEINIHVIWILLVEEFYILEESWAEYIMMAFHPRWTKKEISSWRYSIFVIKKKNLILCDVMNIHVV